MLTLEQIANIEEYSYYIQTLTPSQIIYSFPNGYGASIINHPYSYGIELAVLVMKNGYYQITYETHITSDVVPFIQDMKEIKALLEEIHSL